MPNFSPVVKVDKALTALTRQWQEHHDALAQIEAIFGKYGINPTKSAPAILDIATAPPKAMSAAALPGKRRKRRKFPQSGDEFILSLLDANNSLSTAEINNQWREAGRSGKADINLSKLTHEKKLRREPIKDGRGSTYSVI